MGECRLGWQPEVVVVVVRDFDVPLDSVLWLVVELRSLVRKRTGWSS